jgi:hypothetical protein
MNRQIIISEVEGGEHITTDLKGTRADSRSQPGKKTVGVDRHSLNRALQNSTCETTPPAMNCGNTSTLDVR